MLNITSFIICPKNPKSKIDSNLSLVYLYFICIVQRQVIFGAGDSVGTAFLGSACHSPIMVFCFISSVYKGSTSFHNWKIALILCQFFCPLFQFFNFYVQLQFIEESKDHIITFKKLNLIDQPLKVSNEKLVMACAPQIERQKEYFR